MCSSAIAAPAVRTSTQGNGDVEDMAVNAISGTAVDLFAPIFGVVQVRFPDDEFLFFKSQISFKR